MRSINRKRIRKRVSITALALLLPIILIFTWQYGSENKLINQSILPSPLTLYDTFIYMIETGKLQEHIMVSAERVAKGFAIGTIVGLGFGIIIGLSKRIEHLLSVIIGVFRPIPLIAWVPMLILWMGIGESSKITLIAVGSFWPVLLNTIRGIQNTDKKLLEVAKVLEKSKAQVLVKIIIPSSVPFIFTGIRLGMGAAWSCVVAAEMIAAATGIGYLIMFARELSQPDVMLVGVFTIGFIGLAIDQVLLLLERKILKWNISDEK